ncbi:hypothetical protein ACQV5N_15725, partial [Leptospira koniambonensis]
MSVAQKLLTMFIIGLAGLGIIDGLSIYQMDRIQKAGGDSPLSVNIEKASTHFSNLRSLVFENYFNTDQTRKQEIVSKIQKNQEGLSSLFSKSLDLFSEKKEEELISSARFVSEEYLQTFASGILLENPNGLEEKEFRAREEIAANRFLSATKEISEYIAESNKRKSETTVTSIFSTSILIVSLSLGVITLFAILIWRINVQIRQQLGGDYSLLAKIAKKISSGDLSSEIDMDRLDPNGLLLHLSVLQSSLKELMLEMSKMSQEHEAGDIDVKMDSSKFKGAFKTMSDGINDMVFSHIAVKKKAMECFRQFGEGNMDA